MNNTTTKRNLALAAVFMAETLVVGTLATTTTSTIATTQSAYAYNKKDGNGKGNGNGNTVTIEECKNRGSASGFDTTTNQECENLICTHPGENATCTEEGVKSAAAAPTPTPVNKTCTECFTTLLTPQQITVVVSSEPSLASLCESLERGQISEEQFLTVLRSPAAGVSETIQAQLIECLINAGIPFEPLRVG